MLKKRLILFLVFTFVLSVFTTMTNASISLNGLLSKDVFNEKVKNIPTLPKNKWVKTELKKANTSKTYYFKIKTTKKKGFKYSLTVSRLKDNSNGITNIHVYDTNADEKFGFLMDVFEGKSMTTKVKLNSGSLYFLELCKDHAFLDDKNSQLKFIFKETPIKPNRTKIYSVYKKNKYIYLTFKKSKYTNKYKVAYKTTGKWKYKYSKNTKCKFKKISNKKHYVKVRPIRIEKNKKIYGKWSKIKKVKK